MVTLDYDTEIVLQRLKQYVEDMNVVIPEVDEEYQWFFYPDHTEGVVH